MSFLSGIPIIGDIVNAVSTHYQGKQAIKKAKVDGEIAVINRASQTSSDWITLMAKGALSSWKDEYVLMLLSAPYILAFTPWSAIAHQGLKELALMPDWYTYLFMTVCLASYGIKMTPSIKDLFTKKQ